MQTNEVCRSRFEYQKGYLKAGFAHVCEADFQVAFLILLSKGTQPLSLPPGGHAFADDVQFGFGDFLVA